MAKEQNLAHTKWLCKYHIVFTPKYRRKLIYGQYREEIGKIIRQLCTYKGIEIIEGHMMADHVHMLVMMPPKYSVSAVMGYLKGKSSLMIFDRFSQLKYKYGNRRFWSVGYYVSTVGLNEATITPTPLLHSARCPSRPACLIPPLQPQEALYCCQIGQLDWAGVLALDRDLLSQPGSFFFRSDSCSQ